jgi:uncharacterized Zn finger protein
MLSIPNVGALIRVQTRFGTHTGTVVPNERWDPPNSFCMTGDEHISVRNIMFHNVVQMDVLKGEARRMAQGTGVRAFRVQHKKNVYTVTLNNMKYSCTCVGFQFHKNCKHIKAVSARIAA